MRTHTRVTSSSHELGVKGGIYFFFYRAQHASFTYITTYAYNNNIKTLLGVSSDVGERAMARLLIISALQQDRTLCACEGHIFMCMLYKFFFLRVRVSLR